MFGPLTRRASSETIRGASTCQNNFVHLPKQTYHLLTHAHSLFVSMYVCVSVCARATVTERHRVAELFVVCGLTR